MIVDNTIATIIVEIAEKHKVDIKIAHKMVEQYYSTIKNIIATEPPSVIKLDFFGRIAYNHAWKNKIKEIKEKKEFELKFKV